ncbi:MAG TPA: ferrous iron transport protein B [Thermodesulfovibrionales bacterium]|nr:ferrous iron transport protein B [Thermodesulfovibrionales bacterium]
MSLELGVKSLELKEKGAETRTITVAVAGNPNSGKSTLINAIAGTRLHVGNWPGVTVEKKEALFEFEGTKIKLVDLPGTYSLSPYTQEEIIARDYLVHNKPDVIINVVDSTNLERNLYLTIQMMELGIPIIMALNIYDEAEKKGYKIDTKAISKILGITVVCTVATKKVGMDELVKAGILIAGNPAAHAPKRLNYGGDIEAAVHAVENHLFKDHSSVAAAYPPRWLAFKLMEGDEHVLEETGLDESGLLGETLRHLRAAHDEDIESVMADARYAQAAGLAREVLKRPEIKKMEMTEKIDKIVLNRFLGIPIFFAAMWLVFKLAFDVSKPFSDWIDDARTGPLKRWADAMLGFIHAPGWIHSLATDGVIAGVGFVLVFVPVIAAMMFFITFLEGSGYMARAAFVMDRLMHALGLHGKSFIPMLLGFGCNVPAIYATRVLESERDKKLTAFLIPLMSCGARLPVYVAFIGAFFVKNAGTVLWSMYVLGIVMAILLGYLLKKTMFKKEAPMFIMELPPYRIPTSRDLMIHTWQKLKHFVVKAGTYIFAVSILVWFLLNIPWGIENKRDSLLGKMGQVIAPVLEPAGFGKWEAASSLVAGVIAKEIVVGTMAEIYVPKNEEKKEAPVFIDDLKKMGTSFLNASKNAVVNVVSGIGITSLSSEESQEEKEERSPLRQALQGVFSPLSAYAFMAFVLLYWPCVVVAAAMKQEFGTWRIYGQAVLIHSILAWVVAVVIYQGGKLLGMGG